MIHQNSGGVYRQPHNAPRTYYAHNSRNVAGLRFGNTLRSVRGKEGILRSANAIAFDAGVIERAQADGVIHLEVQIRGGSTYRTSIENLLKHGSLQHRLGRQWVMSLRYYSVDGQEPAATAQTTAEDEPIQGALFDLQAETRRAVYS